MKICPRRKTPEEWLHARVKAVWDKHPDLSYYMIISNEMLFESLLRGLFRAAQTRGIEKMSILLPLVNRCREAQQQHLFISQCAIDYGILCDVGIEIASPQTYSNTTKPDKKEEFH